MKPATIEKVKHISWRPSSKGLCRRTLSFRLPDTTPILLLVTALCAPSVPAQEVAPLDPDDFRVSYIYAAVMGTGTYEIDGRRITMLKMPFKWTQRHLEQEQQPGVTWYAPVSIGYDAVTSNNWLDRIFDEDLVTLSVMPGFEFQVPLGETWTLKPLGNLGLTRDFTNKETIAMSVLGIRGLATWRQDSEGWELRWGLGLRAAGEYQFASEDHEAFFIAETGLDYRRDTNLSVLERKVNAGIYFRVQQFIPAWDITRTPVGDSALPILVELGLSVGLKRPHRVFGLRFERVRIGFQRGDGFSGLTVGSKFPF